MPKQGGDGLGSALKKAQRRARQRPVAERHTETAADVGLQSSVAQDDLEAMMDLAQLASRDFRASRGEVHVLLDGEKQVKDPQAKREAEQEHQEAVRVPRRPPWTREMSAEELDQAEKASFLEWRRALAQVEQDKRVQLTPFEKNLQVWRQLWRVLERSHLVVQVIDARDPMRFLCEDLAKYAKEIDKTKETVLLLNKADLVPQTLRNAWAQYLQEEGWRVLFWSAKAASEEEEEEEEEGGEQQSTANKQAEEGESRILSREELLTELERLARECVPEATEAEVPSRVVVGMVGYPNVGKSSTVNAMVGAKKTSVAAMPGKTKHFQTLNIGEGLCVCDSPGLVFPQYAASKEDLVAAGVMPIDQLTDGRAAVEVITRKVPKRQIEETYGIKLPIPASHEDPKRPPTAGEVMRAYCLRRGFVVASGLPDETRAARMILKDFTSGKLLFCEVPPGYDGPVLPSMHAALAEEKEDSTGDVGWNMGNPEPIQENVGEGPVTPVGDGLAELRVGEADLEAERSLVHTDTRSKQRRPEYKFQKKKVRSKGNRGQALDAGVYDGSALATGKKGGMKRT